MWLDAIKRRRGLCSAIVITYILLSSGCDNVQKLNVVRNDDVTVIKLDNLSEDNLVELSSLVRDVKVVALESSPECLVGEIRRLEVSDSHIYILDKQQNDKIFIFDLSGNFLRTAGTRGAALGNYLELTDFDVENGHLYIYDRLSRQVFIYDEIGNLKEKKGLPLTTGYNFAVHDGFYYLYSNSISELGRLSIYDERSTLSASYFSPRRPKRSSEQSGILAGKVAGGGIAFSTPMNDTIFFADAKSVSAEYYLDFGRNKIKDADKKELVESAVPTHEFYIQNDYAISYGNVHGFSDLLYFDYWYRGIVHPVFYNKKAETYVNSNNIIDDISFMIFSNPVTSHNNTLISVFHPGLINANLKFIDRLVNEGRELTEQGKITYGLLTKGARDILSQNVFLVFYEV